MVLRDFTISTNYCFLWILFLVMFNWVEWRVQWQFFQSHWVIYWDWYLKWLYRIEWPDTALMLGLVVLKASVYMLSAGRAGAAGDSSLHGVESVCTGQWVSARPHTLATNLGAEQFHHAYSSLVLELDYLLAGQDFRWDRERWSHCEILSPAG